MLIRSPELFGSRREFALVMGLLLMVLVLRLGLKYQTYHTLVYEAPFYYTSAVVLDQRAKERQGRDYSGLKLRTGEGWIVYTDTYRTEDLRGHRLRLKLIADERITFWRYLGGFYAKSRIGSVQPPVYDLKVRFAERISGQHADASIASFYRAIFLAEPIVPQLREQIAALGVSHLVALSGLHLTLLSAVLYAILGLLYRPLQQRYFPYRYRHLDLGVVVLGILGFYLWFVGSPPSLLRSYGMLLIGWALLMMGVALVSLRLLLFVVALLLALFPVLVASIGFWFSVAGVGYIFLMLRWWGSLERLWLSGLIVAVGTFVLMQPIVHGLFGATSHWQLLSPVLSVAFGPFYAVAIGLHLVGWGGWMDGGLLWLFALPGGAEEQVLPAWIIWLYIAASWGAFYARFWLGVTLAMAMGYLLYLFV
jgi:competence protein ComEC